MTPTKKSFRFGRLLVQLDRSQVIPNDPGAGTPAIVRAFDYHATYWCACGEDELMNEHGHTTRLTPAEVEWLASLDGEITDFLYRQ